MQIQLTTINTAKKPDDMNAPSWKFHPLKGALTKWAALKCGQKCNLNTKDQK
nr:MULTISPECIES: type II toxin-antitoxin system RelE/ParE family toxin [Photorhabdus]